MVHTLHTIKFHSIKPQLFRTFQAGYVFSCLKDILAIDHAATVKENENPFAGVQSMEILAYWLQSSFVKENRSVKFKTSRFPINSFLFSIYQEIPGLTDNQVPRRLGPKRASRIRKLYNLSKEDDVRHYVIKRPLPQKEGKKLRYKAPKIQRLITPSVLQV